MLIDIFIFYILLYFSSNSVVMLFATTFESREEAFTSQYLSFVLQG